MAWDAAVRAGCAWALSLVLEFPGNQGQVVPAQITQHLIGVTSDMQTSADRTGGQPA